MRIGLIAMSGVRAASEELNRIGLTLPGVVERNRIVASLPSLSLLTLASYVPRDWQVSYHEIADLRKSERLPDGFDLVAISSYSAQIRDAYAVSAHYRSGGVPTVLGGLHVTVLPDEAQAHCTTTVVGEAELTWPRLLADFAAGRLQPRYAPRAGRFFDLADAPMPRYDLLDVNRYNRLTVQTSRGCPHLCDFCASSVLLTPRYTVKPVERVIAEIRRINELWPRPFIEFADDNSFAMRGHYKRLLAALRHEDVKWFTEADVSIADDLELLDLMRESGCRQVLIGLESPEPAGLDGIEIRGNWELKVLPRYEAAIHRIQSRGITVNGCFILGLDGDTERTFDAIYEFAERVGLFEVQLTVLTPFPGTPLYDRLLREGRILAPGAWERCTLFDVNFRPRNLSPERLQSGIVELGRRMYSPDFVQRRRERFFEVLHAARIRPGPGMPEEWLALARN
ncbi:MAG: B12-binding domain-containing radical SAM protein [Planctomycetes bacterium]|nr:B12-binding domain-containing radical SAM protein [Planctomycetota bacterium]